MTQAQINFVSRLIALAQLLNGQFGEMSMLQALFYGAEDYDALITTEALQSVPAFAHMTQADIAEVAYIVSEARNRMNERLEPLAVVTQVV